MTSIRVFDPEKKGQYSGYFDCDSLVVGAITTIAFDSTGKQIATGSSKGWIHAGRLTAGGRFEIAASNAGQHGVLSVRFAPRGDRLVCSRKNGDVEIWPANLHSQIFRFNTGSRPVLIAFIAPGERELFYSDATPFLKRLVLPGGD